LKNFLLLFGLVFGGLAQATQWQVLYSKAYNFPFGVSVSDPIYVPAQSKGSKLRVTYSGANPCYIRAQRIDVYGPDSSVTALLPDSAGLFDVPAKPIARAVIHAHSTKWVQVTCTETLYVQTAPPVSTMSYLGSVTMESDWEMAIYKLAEPTKLSHFRIEVPAFCSDLSIDSADTMTEGVWDDTKQLHGDDLVFQVGEGVGARISAIRLILDKAPATSCPIHFYGSIKP